MNTELKAEMVRFLTREGCGENDRAAAKILAGLDVETRHLDGPAFDVLLSGDPERVADAKSSELAGRIENAVRESVLGKVRQVQWVEEKTGDAPRTGTGAGTGPDPDQPPYRNSAPHPSKPPYPRGVRPGGGQSL